MTETDDVIQFNETREQKFVRLAQQRMLNVQKHMGLVANLGSYPHTPEQRDKILSEIRRLVGDVEDAFSPPKQNKRGFTF